MKIIKELDEVFRKGSKTYTQIGKNDNAYLYEITDSHTDHIYYEVFKRQENRRFNCISYPTDKAFGKWAWCISRGNDHIKAHEAAINLFHMLSVVKQVA